MSAQVLPTYKTPPLSEVTFGVQFAELAQFRSAHIGLLWQRFRKDFPKVEQVPPIAEAGSHIPMDSSTGLPHPRTWFINAAESRLIQFQPDRLYYNWRTKEIDPGYPRFTELSACFFESYDQLERWADEAGLGTIEPKSLSLAYTNHIAVAEAGLPEQAAEITTDFHWDSRKTRFLPAPQSIAWNATFPLPGERGQLAARLSEGLRTYDAQKVLALELSANGTAKSATRSDVRDWFDAAHAFIVNAFADLTQIEVQKAKWGRT